MAAGCVPIQQTADSYIRGLEISITDPNIRRILGNVPGECRVKPVKADGGLDQDVSYGFDHIDSSRFKQPYLPKAV